VCQCVGEYVGEHAHALDKGVRPIVLPPQAAQGEDARDTPRDEQRHAQVRLHAGALERRLVDRRLRGQVDDARCRHRLAIAPLLQDPGIPFAQALEPRHRDTGRGPRVGDASLFTRRRHVDQLGSISTDNGHDAAQRINDRGVDRGDGQLEEPGRDLRQQTFEGDVRVQRRQRRARIVWHAGPCRIQYQSL